MLRQIEGSRAVAEAVALARPEVICAYPISPQTHIVEALGELVKEGALAPCEFINVESEFAAMSVAIGASAAGARAYTATASQGLLFMAEAVYNASGLGLPIVMTVANRAIGAPINIWNDHSDSMSQRDCGWIQLFAAHNQEALDLHIQAFKLAEELSMPVMVCMDGFILTHAYERVDMPTQAQVDAFLPPYEPRQVLDVAEPVSIGAMVGPEAFAEVRYLAHARQLRALELIPQIAADFGAGRISRDAAQARIDAGFDEATAMASYRKLRDHNVFVTPTLNVERLIAYLDSDDHSREPFLAYIGPGLRKTYQWRVDRAAKASPEQIAARHLAYQQTAAVLPLLAKAGVTIMAGTDAGFLNSYDYPGLGLHQELALYVKNGLTPAQALAAATRAGPAWFGRLDRFGSIAPGKQADLVLLDRNPLQDIAATRTINTVLLRGKVENRAMLNRLLTDARAQVARWNAAAVQ